MLGLFFSCFVFVIFTVQANNCTVKAICFKGLNNKVFNYGMLMLQDMRPHMQPPPNHKLSQAFQLTHGLWTKPLRNDHIKMNFEKLPVFIQNYLIGELVPNVQLFAVTWPSSVSSFFGETAWSLMKNTFFVDYCVPKRSSSKFVSGAKNAEDLSKKNILKIM